MDRYSASGELLAEQHRSILGPFLVESGTETAVEFNIDGTETVYRKGMKPSIVKPSDQRPLKSWYVETIRERLRSGAYEGYEDMLFDDMRRMNQNGTGKLSNRDMAWLRSEAANMRAYINSDKVV